MNILTFAFVSMSLAGLSNSTFAGENNKQSLSFEDIRVACQNPAKFHNQTAPSNIQVACRDLQTKWVPDKDGTISLGTSREITSSVVSDKYSSDYLTGQLKSMPQVVACSRLKETTELVETVRGVTCDEIIAFNGSSSDFCSGVVNALRAANPDAIKTAVTGRWVNLCRPDYVQLKQGGSY